MNDKPRNMNFGAIFFSVCRGVRDFPKLMYMSPLRVTLHLFFLAFLMALFITVSRSVAVFRSIDRLCTEIEEQCGDFVMGKQGIRPAKEPEKAKLIYSSACSLRYYPDNNFNLNGIKKDLINIGVIWNPGIMVMWIRQPDDRYSVVPLIYPVIQDEWQVSELTKSLEEMSSLNLPELADYIKKKGDINGPFNDKFIQRSISVARPKIKFYSAAIIFAAFLVQIFFQALLFTIIYSIIFSFIGSGLIKMLKIRQLFAVGTYCTFPAIFIASFFPAFRLPLDYQTVFLFAFLIYLIVVFNYLQKVLAIMVQINNNSSQCDKKEQ